MSALLGKIAGSSRFQNAILTVIVLNAVVLGLQTYSGIDREIGDVLTTLDSVFLGVFAIELAIRIGAYGRRPWDFFREPWNVFDFVIVGAAFAPGISRDATVLRLIRLLRVLRVLSVMPDLRVLIRGMAASLAPIGSLAVLAVLVMYVYGMVGWILFHEGDPDNWATISDALLTLFVVMTLESWPEIMGSAMEITSWAWVYFVSYVLAASFLIINVVIAIIITAIEDTREQERREAARAMLVEAEASGDEPVSLGEAVAVEQRIRELRAALDELENEIGFGRTRRGSRSMTSKARLKP